MIDYQKSDDEFFVCFCSNKSLCSHKILKNLIKSGRFTKKLKVKFKGSLNNMSNKNKYYGRML